MSQMSVRKPSFILTASLLLVISFSCISLISYYVANHSLSQHIRNHTLPLTSDNVYSEIQRDLLQPILVSSLMAQDTFVHDWIQNGEQDTAQITRYLGAIQDRYNTVTAFYVSEQSRNYYHSTGIIKQVAVDDPQDRWYFNVRKMQQEFDINLDIDTANETTTTLFVNHKIHNRQGIFLGVIGVGLASQTIMELIETYQNRYGRQIYFIDRQGYVVLHGSQYNSSNDIRQVEGLNQIATQILTSPGGSYHYSSNDQQYQIKTRLVPELDWYLIVEHTEHSEQEVTTALWINLTISFLVTIVITTLIYLTLKKYQRKLELMANTDPLTGTANRNACESTFEQLLKMAKRQQQPISTILVDIDHFKAINDDYGHLIGDKVLIKIAEILNNNLRQSDLLCRWGGDEFLIILPNCDEANALLMAEKMRHLIAQSLQILEERNLQATASFGVAEYNQMESASNLFSRTDKALYQAKATRRNSVFPSEIVTDGGAI